MSGPGSKAAEPATGASGGLGGRTPNPAAFTLVHAVGTKREALFTPTRLMNPVSYIGRTPQNDLVLGSENVSRRHAKIIVTDVGITVHDLDSHNGVFLNGKKVRSANVNVGDLLYVADVCIELRRSPDVAAFSEGTTVAHSDITGEEDPDARSVAALTRVSEALGRGSEDTFAQHMIEICRELVEATVAVLVQRTDDDEMNTLVVLQPEAGKPIVVLWPLVRKALDESTSQVSADLKRDPISNDEAVTKQTDVGAVMVVPLVGSGIEPPSEAIYLARPTPGPMFTAREATTIAAISQMAALRRRKSNDGHVNVLNVDSHGDVVAAQAKTEAAEERLREAQQDVRSLTERIHGLESDALKLKQTVEMEKQNALDAKREADRARAEANKLDQGLHKTDEDVKRLKDALVRSEEERAKLKEAFRASEEDRKGKGAEIEKLREALKNNESDREKLRSEIADHVRARQEQDDELHRREDEVRQRQADIDARDDQIKQLSAELEKLEDESRTTREGLEKAVADSTNASDVLKNAMRATLPPGMAEHIEAAASEQRELVTDATVRPVGALFITLRGFDAWANTASPNEIKRRLDHFCNSVALRARANNGRVEQVLGHMHLVVFDADAASLRDALRCGLEVRALVPDEPGGTGGPVGVAIGLHVGNIITGYFGDGDTATHIDAGEVIVVARGITALADESSFFCTKDVQKLVAGDPAFVLGMAGPANIADGPKVTLFSVMPAEQPDGEGGGA